MTYPDSTANGYTEDHCALRWPLVLSGFGFPLLLAAVLVLGITTKNGLLALLLPVVVILWGLSRGFSLPYVWPTGIRLDDKGVRIGGVGWAEHHPGRKRHRTPVAPGQRYYVFSCPWEAVERICIVTDRQELRTLSKRSWAGGPPGHRVLLGMLTAPYARAALLIVVDPDIARFPEFTTRRGLYYSVLPAPGSIHGIPSPYWVAPTRHPERLTAALRAMPQSSDKLIRESVLP